MHIRILLASLALAFSLAAHARPGPPLAVCSRVLTGLTERVGATDYLALYRSLAGNRSFARFLRQQPRPPPRNAAESRELILHYFVDYAMRFDESPAVERLRRRSFARSLERRGHAVRGDAFAEFQTISRTNLERAFHDNPYEPEPEMKAFEEFVDRAVPVHVHNSQNVKAGLPVPLLSFDRLAGLGFGTTELLSDTWFSREFMGTTDDVFFHVSYGRTDATEGRNQLLLDPAFADRYGTVSPFVMYAGDLLEFGRTHSPVDYETIRRALMDASPGAANPQRALGKMSAREQEEFIKETSAAWMNIKRKLADFDFTRGDFQTFVRRAFLSRVQATRRRSPAEFASLVERMRELPAWEMIRDEVYRPAGFVSGFELRLPLTIPPAALRDAAVGP